MNFKINQISYIVFASTSIILSAFGLNRSFCINKKSRLLKILYGCYCTIFPVLFFAILISDWRYANVRQYLSWVLHYSKYAAATLLSILKSNNCLYKSYSNMNHIVTTRKKIKTGLINFIFFSIFIVLELYNLINTSELFVLNIYIIQLYVMWIVIFVINLDYFWIYIILKNIDGKLDDVYQEIRQRKKYKSGKDTNQTKSLFLVTSKFIKTAKSNYMLNRSFSQYKDIVKVIKDVMWLLNPVVSCVYFIFQW